MSIQLKKLKARFGTRAGAAFRRFVLLGQPRSGTTYLMTLLNSHPDVLCHGEQYNPYAVIDVGERDDSHETVLGRDRDPVGHMQRLFSAGESSAMAAIGFKFMLGQNLAALEAILDDPDLCIIYVKRSNKLAQVASWLVALKSQEWARTVSDPSTPAPRLPTSPRKIAQHWHEFATQEMLFERWLESCAHPRLDLEYRELFAPDIAQRLCRFLNVRPVERMTSPLVKQGANKIMERFENPEPIKYYFREIGRGDWLHEEL